MTEQVRDEVRQELAELVAALRAHVEWHAVVGSTGFPRAPSVARAVETRAERASEVRGNAAAPPPARSAPPMDAGAPGRADAPSVAPPRVAPAVAAREVEAGASGAAAPGPSAPVAVEPSSAPAEPRVRALEPARLATIHQGLAVIREQVRGCTACPLHAQRTNTVFSRGTGSSGLVFVGEGPGADEDAQGEPFVGLAGQLLDRMIDAMGLLRDEVYVCNIVKCRPPRNRKPAPEEMQACRGYLEAQLELLDPAAIVALGATAVEGLLGTTEGITRMRGRWRLYRGRTAVMPTFHPAYLLRTPGAKREVWEDLKSVLHHLGRPVPERKR